MKELAQTYFSFDRRTLQFSFKINFEKQRSFMKIKYRFRHLLDLTTN